MSVSREIEERIRSIDIRTGSYSTEEQIEFAADFRSPMISFSNPGTGKTHSIIRGLIIAQTCHGIAGRNINAMSFTREATAELSRRYEKVCKQLNMTPTVQFNTFHSICRQILNEKYPEMKITSGYITEDDLESLQMHMADNGIYTEDKYYVKRVLEAINLLNHSLIYDDENVELSYAFKQLDISIDVFQQLRKELFVKGIISSSITQGDIPNYALYVLEKNLFIKQKFRKQYKIMVVDEFQDMTKLYLTVLSRISENLIVIGDMKQQIYGFNGASADIVDEYKKLYPNAREVNLTQSFRCKDEIANFATSVYLPNDQTVEAFKGIGSGGEVDILSARDLNIKDIVASIAEENKNNRNLDTEKKSTMFLFRNNYSITPIAEELFKQSVPFRVKKFYKVMDMPVFKELNDLASLALNPTNLELVKSVTLLFPQFKSYRNKPEMNPLYLAMKDVNKKNASLGNGKKASIFDINYAYNNMSEEILSILQQTAIRISRGCLCATAFTLLLPIYDKYIIEGKWWKLEKPLEFYTGLVAPIVNNKTYEQMVQDELEKESAINRAVTLQIGIKCYTMHSAKGLEADHVYIIDADSGVFPNDKKLDKLIENGCEYEAAKTLHEERNLIYVGITRAKSKCVIAYNDELTELIHSPRNNKYCKLDEVFMSTKRNFADVERFMSLMHLKQQTENKGKKVAYTNENMKKETANICAI